MPLGTAVLAPTQAKGAYHKLTRPAQLTSRWRTIIDAGGMDNQDAATITDPDAEITESTTHILKVGEVGTTLRLRLRYDDGTSSVTNDAVIKVFGRHSSADPWQNLENRGGAITTTMTIATTTDVSDGTDNFTAVDATDHAWDLDGCDEVLVGVVTLLNTNGNDALASLEAKVI